MTSHVLALTVSLEWNIRSTRPLGTHGEMINRGGHYARLFGGQSVGRDFSDAAESTLELSGIPS